MDIGILGTGVVGQTIGTRLTGLGHRVRMGARNATNEKASAWAEIAGSSASYGTFADAAEFGEVLFNCTAGMASLQALQLAGERNLRGKVLLDLANPLDSSRGMPPSLSICNTDSLAEQIQAAFPELRVVKTLNTMNCNVMVHPDRVPGDHTVFVSGNDADAKSQATEILAGWFGWPIRNIIDLGDITTARGPEMMLPVWIRVWGVLQTPAFNFHIVAAPRG